MKPRVGLGIGTTSCNNGDQPTCTGLHCRTSTIPLFRKTVYRMSGGADELSDRFEQIGQSWLKHAFGAFEGNNCNFGCNTSGCTTGSNLWRRMLGSIRFQFKRESNRARLTRVGRIRLRARSHRGQPTITLATTTTGTSHRVTVGMSDLDSSLESRRYLLRRSAVCYSARIRVVPSPIPGNATCTTMSRTVSLAVSGGTEPISHFHL